jgi:hypothetical protein
MSTVSTPPACLNDACRHQAVIDVSSYPPDTPVPWFRSRKWPSWVDVRPKLEERPERPIELDCRLIPGGSDETSRKLKWC